MKRKRRVVAVSLLILFILISVRVNLRTADSVPGAVQQSTAQASDIVTIDSGLRGPIYVEDAAVCPEPISLLILIPSTYTALGFSRRVTIRHTWASYNSWHGVKSRVLFFIGDENLAANRTITFFEHDMMHGDVLREQLLFNDTTIMPMEDSYHGLAAKMRKIFQIVLDECGSQSKLYVAKVDDDTFLNLPFLTNLIKKDPPNGVLCHVWSTAKVPYCAGAFYMLQLAQLKAILRSVTAAGYPLKGAEDELYTGEARVSAGVPIVNRDNWIPAPNRVLLPEDAGRIHTSLAVHLASPKLQDAFWAELMSGRTAAPVVLSKRSSLQLVPVV